MASSEKQSCGASFGNFVSHEGDNGQTLWFGGRTSGAWGKTLLFYGVFYGMLSAFWISCFTGMQSYIPAYEDGPELQDIIQDTENIYLQNYPARYENTKDMVTFPGEVPSLESNDEDWAVFPAGDENEGYSVDPFGRIVEKLDEWLLEYTDQTIDVTDGQITNIKTFCGEYYGFDTMQPCFFLKLNRIRGRTLRGSNELADSCANGGADEEEGWKLGDEWKVMEKRNCAASGASFLPITCVEKTTGENGVQVVSPLTFTVKSWLDATDYESDVKGLAFVPFLNTADSIGYRDPVVAVRPDSVPVDSDGEPRHYQKIECEISLADDTEFPIPADEVSGQVEPQRVVNSIIW